MKGEKGKMSNKNGGKSYRRNDMSNEEWEKIKDYIREKKGRAEKDDRNFLNGVFWILRTGASWRNLPPDYGKWYTVHKRFLR